ncbi:hypothetical protein BY996DRAFT_7212596 [Phakopsora pachyrhizi]|nr:hypothetical protein BY996DRAFT_7212596 [Phakopsora pachyrhizi]
MLLSELMTETKSLDSITREAISDVVKDINASKGLKFDLNELPENLESEVSDSEFEKLLELEKSERESNINSNKRSLEPFEDSKSLDLSHSPKRLRTKSSITTERTLNHLIYLEPRPFLIETIKTLLSVEIKKSGPFDLEGKRKYSSPYNRDLLDLLEKKLQSVMPKELDEFEFQDGFLITIKENFWSNNLGFFTSFIKFENLSRFFYTDNIRQKSILFFDNLNKSLLKGKEGYGHKRKTPENAILNQIWLGMNGFLALVPLKQEQLVAKQEEAFKFFQRAKKMSETYFEEIRDNSMNQLFESKLSRNKVAWIYIELWLIKCRPELQNINFGKFQSLIDRMCLIFFSGMVKRETLEHEKLAERELQI